MDLLFKRYASPFDYLNLLLESGNFESGVNNIWDTAQDEKAWGYYLSNNPMNNKSFEEWKQEIMAQQQAKKPMSKVQVSATVIKSQNILKGFNPKQN